MEELAFVQALQWRLETGWQWRICSIYLLHLNKNERWMTSNILYIDNGASLEWNSDDIVLSLDQS